MSMKIAERRMLREYKNYFLYGCRLMVSEPSVRVVGALRWFLNLGTDGGRQLRHSRS